jgi:hypothetical protein
MLKLFVRSSLIAAMVDWSAGGCTDFVKTGTPSMAWLFANCAFVHERCFAERSRCFAGFPHLRHQNGHPCLGFPPTAASAQALKETT